MNLLNKKFILVYAIYIGIIALVAIYEMFREKEEVEG